METMEQVGSVGVGSNHKKCVVGERDVLYTSFNPPQDARATFINIMRKFLNGGNRKKYFTKTKFFLRLIGMSLLENDSFIYKLYSRFVVSVFICLYGLVSVGDLIKNKFEVDAESFAYIIGGPMVASIALVVYINRKRLGKLIHTLENEPFTANFERGGNIEEKLIGEWYTFTAVQGLVFIVCVAISYFSRVGYTLSLRIRSNDYHDWDFSYGPLTIVNVTYSPNFEILLMYQNISVAYLASYYIGAIVIATGIMAYVSVQFKLLQNNLRRLVENSHALMLKDYGEEFSAHVTLDPVAIPWKYLRICVKNAVMYHISILKMFREMQDIFSTLMLIMYLFTISMLCCQVYLTSTIPMIYDPRLMSLVVEMSSVSCQAFLLCYWGEQVAQESEAVGDAAMEMNFVGTDVRLQKALSLIIRKSQDPLRIKAGKFIETSLLTFAWILRATYSSFAMLRSISNG